MLALLTASLLTAATPLDDHLEWVRERTRGRGFTVVVARPFVVIGDGTPADVHKHAARVRWTMERLRRDFFAVDPDEPIDVWVFANERSYRKYAKLFFNDEPDTPYGYYSPDDRALIMNIGPGYGTLVHELVHPYIRANWPGCPPWIDEGLASLYERPVDRGGHIAGLVNWRLRGLKRAIQRGHVPPLGVLAGMDAERFYDDDTGAHYAASRYLMYELQERGLLVRFIREARDAADSGWSTFLRLTGDPDEVTFQRDWETRMSKL